MSMLNAVRCAVRLHAWGPVTGDDWGAHQTCSYCGHIRRLKTDAPPEAHDFSNVHH